MTVIEDIIAKCEEINGQVEFIKTLAGKASDPKWVAVDPGYSKMREMASLASDQVIILSNELKALIP